MHEWMCADLRFICMRVYSSAFLHLMQEGRGVGGCGRGCEKGGWVLHRRGGAEGVGGGALLGLAGPHRPGALMLG